MLRSLLLLVLTLLVIAGAGCSQGGSDPMTPANNQASGTVPVSDYDLSGMNHSILGAGTINFDLGNMKATVEPDREMTAHLNVTTLLPNPTLVINSFDPVTSVVDVDFTIHNPYAVTGYDLRLIIFTDGIGHKLTNFDDWTSLYDIAGGLPINPFKAYAKSIAQRAFAGPVQMTEKLLVKLPGGNPNVKFVIEASYPGNCAEPYEIKSWGHDQIFTTVGSSNIARVRVDSWPNNLVNSVNLYLPQVAGASLVSFAHTSSNIWTATLTNNVGAAAGDYVGYIIATTATSGGLALYDEVTVVISDAPTGATYVGSAVCSQCHSGKYDTWSKMGHHFIMNPVNGSAPVYPYSSVPSAPPGYSWDDITRVIGGYLAKSYFIDTDGYYVTGTQASYYLETADWHENSPTTPPGTKAYTCGACHTTGWVATSAKGPHKDGLPGIYGTYSEAGLGCEKCHGPGSNHIQSMDPADISIDSSAAFCGGCHKTGATTDKVYWDTTKNLVKSHSQYNEFLASPHSWGGCNTCHDVHSSVKYDSVAPGTGIKVACTSCHDAATHTVPEGMSNLVCIDCHMPKIQSEAVTHGTGAHQYGDTPGHIFRIDTTGVTLANYTETDGTNTWIKPINGAVRLNLSFACMGCHDGNTAFAINSYSTAAAMAAGMHG